MAVKKAKPARLTKNGKRLGRPPGTKNLKTNGGTRYHPSICKDIVAFMKRGYSKTVIAAQLKINPDTLRRWIKEHKELADAIEEGMMHSQLWWETLGIRGASGKVKGFNASAWVFNMKNRFGWKDKQEISGDEDRPISVRVVKFSEMQDEKIVKADWKKIDNLEPSEPFDMKKLMQ